MLRLDFLHDMRELVDLVGAEHEVDVRRALDERIALLLRHAARDAENQLRVLALEALDLADLAVDAVLRRLAHAARVDEDEVSLLHRLRPLIADRAELSHHALCIALVHLASIDQEVHIAVQLAIYHVHTFFSVLFFAVYLIINALLYQKWARLSMTQAIEERQYKDAARRSFPHAASTICGLSLSDLSHSAGRYRLKARQSCAVSRQ